MSEPLMEFTSHIQGRNAKVAIYEDRIEWRQGWRPAGGAKAAVMTMGVSLTVPGRRDTNMIPIRQIKATITRLMLSGGTPPAPVPPAAPAAQPPVSVADELAKLVQLRDAGALTEEEFAAQKARLLGS